MTWTTNPGRLPPAGAMPSVIPEPPDHDNGSKSGSANELGFMEGIREGKA